ncbi:hypothetical protein O4H61_10655 [Roseovarius aestuarii]|nr:hypothetical protein [Roseovarius aestuarii]
MRITQLLHRVTPDHVRRCIYYCILPALAFYAVSVIVMSLAGFTVLEILRDTAQLTKHNSFLGFVSSIGSWLWVSAATLCFFGMATYDGRPEDTHRRLLKLTGWFGAVLAVDDFFLIHDRYIAEGILVPLYAAFVIYLVVKFRDTIAEVDALAFLTAGGMLFMSVAVDAVQEILPVSYAATQILEEGFKFLGGAGWLYFCFRLAAWQGKRS